MSFRSQARTVFFAAVFLLAGCSRQSEGEQLGREYAEYIAPAAGKERQEDIAARFARGYVDRIRSGQVAILNSARQVPPDGVNWSTEQRNAYWSGYMRGGSVLVEESEASGRRGKVMLEAAGLSLIVAVPFWWMRRRGGR